MKFWRDKENKEYWALEIDNLMLNNIANDLVDGTGDKDFVTNEVIDNVFEECCKRGIMSLEDAHLKSAQALDSFWVAQRFNIRDYEQKWYYFKRKDIVFRVPQTLYDRTARTPLSFQKIYYDVAELYLSFQLFRKRDTENNKYVFINENFKNIMEIIKKEIMRNKEFDFLFSFKKYSSLEEIIRKDKK